MKKNKKQAKGKNAKVVKLPEVKSPGENEEKQSPSATDGIATSVPKPEVIHVPKTEPGDPAVVEKPKEEIGVNVENDNIVTLEELGQQIVEYHVKAEASEKEASINVWESGTRLNQAYDRVYADRGYGSWGNYLKQNCPSLSRTTVWRYRKVAGCFTVEQPQEKTLSELYAICGVADFQKEPLGDDNSEPTTHGSGASDKNVNPYAKVLGDLVKASKKFDTPASMSQFEKTAVKEVAIALEEVHGKLNGLSIVSIAWHDKLAKPVPDWDREERALFEVEFARLVQIHEQIQSIAEEA